MSLTQAIRASAVDHALGVQTDLTTGNWSSIPSMIAEATFIGADTVRVFAPTDGNWTVRYGYVDQLADAGLKLDFIVDTSNTPASNVAAIAAFLERHPGSVSLVEGPNEPNNFGVDYAGRSGIAGAVAWQADFYAAVKANPVTAGVTIAGVASYPLVAVASDENNLHVYPDRGDQPGATLARAVAEQTAVDPGKPFAITELGWFTQPGATQPGTNWVGVDEATQTKLVLNAYLDAARSGATNIGLYDLRDWAGTDTGSHFGLFNNDDTPKPVATALHALQAILGDAGQTASSFAPGTIDYTLAAPADVNALLMQKSTGEFVLALWREPDVWNEATGTPIAAAAESVTLRLAAPAATATYDPVTGAAPTATTAATTTVTANLTDHPIFITISPAPTAAAAAAPAAAIAAHPDLIVNGSFEAGPHSGAFETLAAGSTAIEGWTVTSGSIDDIHAYWQAADGGSSLDLNGNAPGTIAQTFSTVAGQDYDVHFALAANPDDHSRHGLRVSAADASQDFHVDDLGQDHDHMAWVSETFHFTATGTTTTLAFAGLDPSFWGAALDDVSVTAASAQAAPAATVSSPAAPAAAIAAHPDLIVNGSFEAGPHSGAFETLAAGSTAIEGWTVTSGSIDDIHAYWQAADGGSSLDLNGNAPGAIAQTFATVAGQDYDVRFALAANPDDHSRHGLRVSAADASQDFHIDDLGQDHDHMAWANESFHFTATGTTTTLEFAGLDPSFWGAALDNVSVTAVGFHMG